MRDFACVVRSARQVLFKQMYLCSFPTRICHIIPRELLSRRENYVPGRRITNLMTSRSWLSATWRVFSATTNASSSHKYINNLEFSGGTKRQIVHKDFACDTDKCIGSTTRAKKGMCAWSERVRTSVTFACEARQILYSIRSPTFPNVVLWQLAKAHILAISIICWRDQFVKVCCSAGWNFPSEFSHHFVPAIRLRVHGLCFVPFSSCSSVARRGACVGAVNFRLWSWCVSSAERSPEGWAPLQPTQPSGFSSEQFHSFHTDSDLSLILRRKH